MVYKIVFLAVLLLCLPIFAKDLGQHGQVFVIKEQDIIEYIKAKLANLEASGELNQHQNIIAKKIEKTVRTPTPVSGIVHTEKERVFYFDPTYIVRETITNHIGQTIANKRDKINPLDTVSLNHDLIFIDGADEEQVSYALEKIRDKPEKTKIILVNGSPLALQEKHNIWIYFDQQGYLTGKLGISQVPAIVTQEGKQLKIREVTIDG